MGVWKTVDEFLEKHHDRFRMSFGLEYSNTVDWVADFTPRINHPEAREYGLWQGQSPDRETAIRNAMAKAEEGIKKIA